MAAYHSGPEDIRPGTPLYTSNNYSGQAGERRPLNYKVPHPGLYPLNWASEDWVPTYPSILEKLLPTVLLVTNKLTY